MPLILPGNVATALGGGYEVANSVRYNDGDSPKMEKTTAAGSNTIGTFSCWVKRGALGTDQAIFTSTNDTVWFKIWFHNEDYLRIDRFNSSSFILLKTTNMKFRDISAWYHIHIALDTTNGTAEDRMILTVNGTRVTSFASSTNSGSSDDLIIGTNTYKHRIGANQTSGDFFDGYLAEVVWIDGTASAASNFGEFDSDSPTIWKPKDVSGLSVGTNGYYLDFEDSSNLGNDANGGTDFTETNLAATDQTSDTCTNNFATMNPLYHPPSDAPTLSEGNCKVVSNSTSFLGGIGSTIGVASGKWYIEVKVTTRNTGAQIGVTSDPSEDARNNRAIGYLSTSYGYQEDGQEVTNDTRGTYGATYDTDIIGIALDCDNNKIYYSKNGGWSDGDGTSDASTPNDYQTITAPASTPTGFYFFGASDGSSSATNTYEFNFGNPTFSISSGNADANGYGNFEYAVPSGYLALCTKNLGSDGG